jgi:hypothetical protein
VIKIEMFCRGIKMLKFGDFWKDLHTFAHFCSDFILAGFSLSL